MSTAKTIVASTSQELAAALADATGGETILLRDGGEPFWLSTTSGYTPAATVLIMSEDPAAPVTFTEITLYDSRNIEIAHVAFDSRAVMDSRPGHLDDFNLVRSSNITLRDSTAVSRGDGLIGRNHAAVGENFADIRSSTDVVIRDTTIANYRSGIYFDGASKGVSLIGNTLEGLQADGIRAAGGDDIEISGNVLSNFQSSTFDVQHVDMIQFWNISDGLPAATNVTISDNVLMAAAGAGTQSIFLNNEQPSEGLYRNITIENNTIYNGHVHGIYVGQSDGVVIESNTMLTNPFAAMARDENSDFPLWDPIITSHDLSRDVRITNNVTAHVKAPSSAVVSGNFFIDYNDPLLPTHVDRNFVNASAGDGGSVAALQVLAGSTLATYGAGAEGGVYEPKPPALTALYTQRVDGGDPQLLHFDASLTAGPDGPLNPAETLYRWTFDEMVVDGGPTISHHFDTVGRHTVSLTVTTSAGDTASMTSMAAIADPLLLDLAMSETGVTDKSASDAALDYRLDRLVVEPGMLETAYRLRDDNEVDVERDNDFLHGRSAFSFDFLINMDAHADANGAVLYLHKALQVSVTASNAVNLRVSNANGEVYSVATADGAVKPGEWLHVVASYDAAAERVEIFLDGVSAAVGYARGATPSKLFWGLHLGHPWSGSFNGLVENLEMRATPTDAVEAAQRHAAATTAPPPIDDPVDDHDQAQSPTQSDTPLLSYGPDTQDFGVVEIDAAGAARLSDNAWKQLAIGGEVTADTVLYLTFDAPVEGEIHGIGLMDGDRLDPGRIFKLHGAQDWGIDAYDDQFAGAGPQAYRIAVGEHFTGAYDRLVLVADDDAAAAGVSVFSDIRLVEERPDGAGGFEALSSKAIALTSGIDDVMESWLRPFLADVQDFGAVQADAGQATLSDNAWKQLAMGGEVTTDTVLYLTFDAPVEGEIHGIGLVDGDQLDPGRIFKLHGAQDWGIDAYDGQFAGAGPQAYRIAVGEHFTGAYDRLVLVADDDAAAAGVSMFSDIRLVEERPDGAGGVIEADALTLRFDDSLDVLG